MSKDTGESVGMRKKFVVVLLASLLIVFVYLLSTLLFGVIAGLLLWTLTRSIFDRVSVKLKGRESLSAMLSVAATGLVVVVPIAAVGLIMVADAASLADRASAWFEPHREEINTRLSEITSGGSFYVFDYEIRVDDLVTKLENSAAAISKFLLELLQKAVGGVAQGIMLVFVTLYSLFFFYKDGDKFFGWLKRMLPLDFDQSDRLINDFFSTSRATIKTVGILGAIQGVMGGVAFWICGIPSPFFWTILMVIASVIPAVGVQIITFPVGILLVLVGKTGYGIGLLLWSWIAIANVDNFLRPYLVRRDVDLHELLVFLSTLGGIATFGFFGFLIGPVIAALLKATFQIYSEVFQRE